MSTPKPVLRALDERDGHVCAWHGVDGDETGERCDPDTLVPQHRQGGMGGRRNKHRLSNVVWLDSLMNGLIESDAVLAAEARRRGIKISIHADPTRVPVAFPDGDFLLGDDGTKRPVEPGRSMT